MAGPSTPKTPVGAAMPSVQTGQVPAADPAQSKANTFKSLLERSHKEIAAALPKHLTADRLSRIAMTEVRKNPELLNCDQASLLGAVIQAAQLGLEPGSALGHCYLIPFNNRQKNRKEIQFIIGYRGMLDLARRSGSCNKVDARAVYQGDEFTYQLGLDEKLVHVPAARNPGDQITHVYAIAALKNGTKQFDVMTRAEVEEIRGTSATGDKPSSPWATDYEAMAKKTVIRRLFKYLPVSIEIQQAVGLDEMADRGISQGNGAFIETQGRVLTKAEQLTEKLGVATYPEQTEDDLPIEPTRGTVHPEPSLPGGDDMFEKFPGGPGVAS